MREGGVDILRASDFCRLILKLDRELYVLNSFINIGSDVSGEVMVKRRSSANAAILCAEF